MSEALQMELYNFPRVDDFGFLEFLLLYLEDLQKDQEILLIKEIDALHVEIRTLLDLAKSRNQELDKKQWNDIMNLAYQAEYRIDLYLATSPRDLGLISSLSKIIQQLGTIKAYVTCDLSRLFQSPSDQDVAAETSKPQDRDNDKIVGLQEEIDDIMGDLLEDQRKLVVVTIVGMPGVGKTTLVEALYNNPSIVGHFHIRAWCDFSQSYQLRDLLVSLLNQVNASDKVCNLDDQDLADHFYRSLRQRRYLIILADVWVSMLWEELKRCLPDDSNGSRIIITTGIRDVAGHCESRVYELHGLSDKNSWELFQKNMYQIESLSNDLLTISKGIVKNCKGLPLFIVRMARILSGTERTVENWNHIAELRGVKSNLISERYSFDILELVYSELPNQLRSCFLYLGSFPEDEEISVNRVIRLWIAEGLVQHTEIDTSEEIAKKYIKYLTERSLVIPGKKRSGGGVETFRLHDLVREFCIDKSKKKHFFTFLDSNDEIVGFQEEAKKAMGKLFSGKNKLSVVSVIGMAGVGKSTLALTLYNSHSTEPYFDIRARCVVSQSYKLRALLVSLLHQVNASDKISNTDDQELADDLCRSLKGRRYLILLDDIWDTTLWNNLKQCLPDNRNGSRILITTRYREVANQFESKVIKLGGLSYENSWKLFQKKIPQIECLSDDLLTISNGIVRNCKGLPLSIVIVAGILSNIERTEVKWNQIARNVSTAVLSEEQGNCRDILELSYNHLPNHLRSCFLYLGTFPEDKEISVNRLILLWIGEGFIQDTDIDTAEEIAKRYVENLIMKSLMMPAKRRSGGGVKTFRLHDLLRDFCLAKAKEEHFFTSLGDEVLNERNHSLALQDPRRIIMNGSSNPARTRVDFSFHSVRSLICHGKLDTSEIKKRIGSCDMVLLRVLDVDDACSDLFSTDNVLGIHVEDISCLIHLRYLAFRCGPWIEQDSVFRSSISKLKNLQILILIQRLAGYKVPDFIWDMVKLRHVHVHEASFEVDSNRLQNSSVLLENLKSLCVARVSYGDSKWLSKLFQLQRLHCLFTIDDLEVDSDVKETQFRTLSFNGALISLKVANQTGRVQRLISTCQLPKSLRELTLSSFYLESNDISIIGRTLTHLEVFKIYSCGVPSGYEWNVDVDDFPKLKVLKLGNLKICMWTVSECSFPILEQLWVKKCECLDEIPLEFGSLSDLRIITVEGCPPSVNNSARKIEKEQHEGQNTEMKVHIS